MRDGCLHVAKTPAIGKGVRRDVEHAHDHGLAEVEREAAALEVHAVGPAGVALAGARGAGAQVWLAGGPITGSGLTAPPPPLGALVSSQSFGAFGRRPAITSSIWVESSVSYLRSAWAIACRMGMLSPRIPSARW